VKVDVDEELCCGSGLCVVNADQVFDQREEDGTVVLLTGDPAPELHGAVRAAASVCPTSAIKLVE